MQLESIAVAFVFIANAVAIIMLAFMLFRILGQTKATHGVLSGQAQRLQEAAQRLYGAISGVDRLVERLIEANRIADAEPKPVNLSDESLQRLQAMSDETNAAAMGDIQRMLVELRGMLAASGSATPPAPSASSVGGSMLNAGHDAETAYQPTQPAGLDGDAPPRARTPFDDADEIEQLREQLQAAQLLIADLRHAQHAGTHMPASDVLRDKLDQQEQLLARTKERAHKAEGTVNTLKQDIDRLTAQVMQAQHASSRDMEQIQTQMSTLSQERATLQTQLEEIRDTLKRTLIEKDFIEDKLLDLDQSARAAAAAQRRD